MDFVTFVYVYFSFTAILVFALLFGDAPALAGTPVSWLKWLITEAWIDALEWCVNKTCGSKGLRTLDRVTELCCESSNPTLQITYLLLYTFGYGLYWQHVFKLLPNEFAAGYHIYTGTTAVCLTLTTFLIASFSEPGAITQNTAAQHLVAHPCDGVLFPTKQCSTCNIMRPGRSKHCNICGRCIPRFDHHCGWINNCVGLQNMRTFLIFLLANFSVCMYGVWLTVAALAGELKRRGLFDVYIYDPHLDHQVPLYTRPARFAEWLLVYYPIPLAVGMFLAVAGLLMLAFFLYQAYIISQGCTTYETHKRNLLHRQMVAAAVQQAGSAGSTIRDPQYNTRRGWWPLWLANGRQKRLVVELPSNQYDNGFWSNWYEVMCPVQFLQQFERRTEPPTQTPTALVPPAVSASDEKKQR